MVKAKLRIINLTRKPKTSQ